MATDTERLIVLFEARMDQFEREMRRGQAAARNGFRRMEQQAKSFEQRFATAGRNAARAFNRGLSTLGVGIGLGALTRAFNNARQMADDIVNVADRIGITTDQLQEFHFAAVQADVDIGEFDSSLDAFAKRLGDAAKGTGELLKVLEANNVPIRDAAGNLIGVNEQLLVYADLMANAEDEVTKAALSNAAFGRGNVEMQALLSAGSRGFREQAAAARELGGVLGGPLLRETARLNDEWDALTTAAGAQFHGLLLDLATAALGTDGSIEGLTKEITDFIGLLRANPGVTLDIAAGITAIGAAAVLAGGPVAALTAAVLALYAVVRPGGLNIGEDELLRQQQMIPGPAGPMPPPLPIPPVNPLPGRFDDAFEGVPPQPPPPNLAERFADAFEEVVTPPPVLAPVTVLPSGGGGSGGGGGGGGGAAAQADAVAELIQRLKEELELIGKSDLELAIANNLREAGAAATEEQKAEIEALTRQIDAETAATERLAEAMAELGDMAGSALKGIIGDLIEGKSAMEAFGNALAQIGDRLISTGIDTALASLTGSLTGAGTGGGFLAGLAGVARASGGPVSAGRAYMVGERGPEMFVPRAAGRIVPNGAGAGQPIVVHLDVAANDYFDARVGRISAGTANVVVQKSLTQQRDMQRRRG